MKSACFCGKLIFLIFCFQNVKWNEALQKGPYKATVLSILPHCNQTKIAGPLAKDSPQFHFEMYTVANSSYVRGNVTFKKNYPDTKLLAEQLYLEDGKWRVTYRVPGLMCQRGIFRLLVAVFQVNFDRKTCSLLKGVYAYSHISLDYLLHYWQPLAEPGRLMMRVVMASRSNTLFCVELEALIKQIK